MDIKLADNLFQKFVIFSIPLMMCFYWPSHDPRIIKYAVFQMLALILFGMSFLFDQKRKISTIWPAIFLLIGVLNIFTHLMAAYCQMAFTFILFTVMSLYVLMNNMTLETVQCLKKSIVVTALINCSYFFSQMLGVVTVFDGFDTHGRASAFLIYPTHFSLLCAVALFFAWEWKKILCLPLLLGVIWSHEYAVLLGTVVAFLCGFKSRRDFILFVPMLAVVIYLFCALKVHASGNDVLGRIQLRMQFCYPTFRAAFARAIDGFGMGGFRQGFDSIVPGFPKGAWPELHCEPLQLFFEMGLIGMAVFWGWIRSMGKYFTWNVYSKSLLIIGITSCFHSIFHFCDSLWLILMVYAMWEIERVEGAP